VRRRGGGLVSGVRHSMASTNIDRVYLWRQFVNWQRNEQALTGFIGAAVRLDEKTLPCCALTLSFNY